MLDVMALKVARVRANVSIEEIAAELGLNPVTVYRKFDGRSEFTTSELAAVKRILKLTVEEFDSIFFRGELTETQG